MTTEATTQVPKVFEAILGVMKAIGTDGISKNRKNEQQGYSFRGIDEVLNALSPILVENQLLVLPRVLSRDVTERQTRHGGALFYTTVEVEYDFISAKDGSRHTIRTVGEAMDSGDKSTNKAMSAAYKYAAIQAFCIPTQGDNDADSTTHDVASRQHEQQRQQNNQQRRSRQGDSSNRSNGQQQEQQQGQQAGSGVDHEKLAALMRKLVGAAKLGSQAFEKVWKENPGAVRATIFNDKERMEILRKHRDEADAKLAQAQQQQQQHQGAMQ